MKDDIKPGYTRVSQILEMLPTLSNGKWGYPMQNIDPYILARAADRGTNVHAAIKAHWDGEFYPLDEKEQGYFESFKKWNAARASKHVMSENRLYDDLLKITGAIDYLGIFTDILAVSTKPILVDFKTTVAVDNRKWSLQAAFYHFLCERNSIELEEPVLFVQLMADGSFPKAFYYIAKDHKKTALDILNLYRYLTNY